MNNCSIINNQVFRNGTKIFENKNVSGDDFFLLAYSFLEISYPKFHRLDSSSKLAILTTSLIFEGSDEYDEEKTGIITVSRNGSEISDKVFHSSLNSKNRSRNPSKFSYTLPSIPMGEICIRLGIRGENLNLIVSRLSRRIKSALIREFISAGMDRVIFVELNYSGSEFRCDASLYTKNSKF